MEKSIRLRISTYTGSFLAGIALLLIPGQVSAQVTFARDVAPILQENCQVCHRPGGIGPMSLLTYEEARRWASAIKERVVSRMMPPWHLDKTVGIQEYKNDISLSDGEIETIVAWVDAAAPLGDPAELPRPVEWPDGTAWLLEADFGRPPDLVFRSPGFDVEASGNDQWFEPTITLEGIDTPRWAMATESRPTLESRAVTHHGNNTISRFGGPGAPKDIYPPDTGMLVVPGQAVDLSLHYYPVGEAVKGAYIEVAVWFYPEGFVPRYQVTNPTRNISSYRELGGGLRQQMLLAPRSKGITQAFHVLEEPTWITSSRGHMHKRGTGQSLEAIYPDGRTEVLIKYNWMHAWHIDYIFEDHVAPLLPKGTVLVLTSYYDNTAGNPYNPDPDQWVVHGRRTNDEMSHAWVGMQSLTQEDFEERLAEREELLRQRQVAQRQE